MTTTSPKASQKTTDKPETEEANAAVPAQVKRSEAIEGVVLDDETTESFVDRVKRVAVNKKTISGVIATLAASAVVLVIRARNSAADEPLDENTEA